MFWYGHDMNWWGYAGMTIGMVLFWALLIVGIVALIRYSLGNRENSPISRSQTPSPEQILADRFARGDINETEYRERLAVLRNHARP